jgi:hypothetical protein
MSVAQSVIVMIIPKIIAAVKSFRAKSGLKLMCGLFLILRPNLFGFLSYQKEKSLLFVLNNVVPRSLFNVLPNLRQLVTELASRKILISCANFAIVKYCEMASITEPVKKSKNHEYKTLSV